MIKNDYISSRLDQIIRAESFMSNHAKCDKYDKMRNTYLLLVLI